MSWKSFVVGFLMFFPALWLSDAADNTVVRFAIAGCVGFTLGSLVEWFETARKKHAAKSQARPERGGQRASRA